MATPVPAPENPDQYRLPTDVKPTHYDLTVRTDIVAFKFDGLVVAQYVLISTIWDVTHSSVPVIVLT